MLNVTKNSKLGFHVNNRIHKEVSFICLNKELNTGNLFHLLAKDSGSKLKEGKIKSLEFSEGKKLLILDA